MNSSLRLRFCVLFLAALGVACASGSRHAGGDASRPIYFASGKDAVTPDGLHRVKWEPFATSFVRPGATLEGYTAVLLDAVTIAYQSPPRRYAPGTGAMNANFALSPRATDHMKRYFHEALVEELIQSEDFRIATAPGPDVLRISGHIVNLLITAPPEREQLPDEKVYVTSTGSMTLLLDARDSLSGEPLVRVGERRDITLGDGVSQFYWSNPVSSAGAVQLVFDDWARRLRVELDQFKSLHEIPGA
ncbi:MAG: DUF3313 family protein [Myxococcales bacterium]|nr:DUF3313 family protein [Myxococcales bacterium]